ncbi:MAG: HAD-IIIC family phosphatase [Opitutae bacterium]|nr:HAD-IIIC family phosphatase [Opitutae bacterium]
MKTFVFRNATLEPFFPQKETEFSGYGDVSRVPKDAENFLWFYTFPPETAPAEALPVAENFLAKLRLVLAAAPATIPFRAVFLAAPGAKMRAATKDESYDKAAEKFNSALRELARSRENFSCVSVDEKILNDIDWRFFFAAQVPFSPRHAGEIAAILSRNGGGEPHHNLGATTISVPAVRKKCLVLDLDDTLYGGVVGEDGVGGIALGGDYPGNAFAFFQKKISELADAGIILAIASKNNEADVAELFDKRRDMPLGLEKFSAKKIDWRDKATQLREIATELNIGTDTLVFIDNSPAERAWINAALPEVATPEFPKNPFALPEFFASLLDKYFRTEALTREDTEKTAQYATNAARQRFAQNYASLAEYLAALKIELTIVVNDATTYPRLAQLSQKTNQFNLANRRLTLADIEAATIAGARIYALSVRDIFGDNGICGAAIVRHHNGDCRNGGEIAEFALSCRVLGRGIEKAFLAEILRREQQRGAKKIFAEFVATKKNLPAKNFYAENGFSEIETNKFALDISSLSQIPAPQIYKIISK